MSQFAFLEAEFCEQFEPAQWVEGYGLSGQSASIIHARKALESIVKWVFANDRHSQSFLVEATGVVLRVAVVDPCARMAPW